MGEGARVAGSILGPGARVDPGAIVVECVLGAGARVVTSASVEGARVPAGAVAGEGSAPKRRDGLNDGSRGDDVGSVDRRTEG